MTQTGTDRWSCEIGHRAFAQGFSDGLLGVACETAREVEARYPMLSSLSVTAYLNGTDDGRRNDRFRIDMPCGLCGK